MGEKTEEGTGGFCFPSRAPDDTRAAARLLGREISSCRRGPAWVLALDGELGAGKTVFVKGLAEGLGLSAEQVSSPTFVIVHQYRSPKGATLSHVDFYRLDRLDELEAVGWFDLLEPGGVVAVEWAGRFPEALPRDRLGIRLARAGGDAPSVRRIDARATGPRALDLVRRWRAALEAEDAGPRSR